MIFFYTTDMNLYVDKRALVMTYGYDTWAIYPVMQLGGGGILLVLSYPCSFELFLSPGDGDDDIDDKMT